MTTPPKLNQRYRKFTLRNDPRTMLQLPNEVADDLKKMAKYNKRSLREEITARLIASLTHNNEIMTLDRLNQLIFNHQLAVEFPVNEQKKNRR